MQLSSLSHSIILISVVYQVCCITPEKLFTSESKKVYYIETEYKFDWFESLTKCARMNMTLLTIDAKTKSEDINKLVRTSFGENIILWVGGYAVGTNRLFTWVNTGEEFTYTFWSSVNPDFAGKEEFCVQIGWDANMQWNDNKCTKKYGFICEFKPSESGDGADNKHPKSQNIIIQNYQKSY